MKEVDEAKILNLKIRQGITIARDKFEKYHNYYLSDNDIYLDIIEQISISVIYHWEYNNIIDIIFINTQNLDDNLFNKLLNLIKKETYYFGLRIIRKTNCLYVYIDKTINQNIYFVENLEEKDNIEKMLVRKK